MPHRLDDASFIRRQHAGPSLVDRGKPASKMHVLPNTNGPPLLIGVSAANTHDSYP
jgi:hypothetical protein